MSARRVAEAVSDVLVAIEKARTAARSLPQRPTSAEVSSPCRCGHVPADHDNVLDASMPPRQIGLCLVPTCGCERFDDPEAAELAWRSWARQIGVPVRLLGASLHGERSAALARVENFVRSDFPAGRCLILAGPPGVGKTYASVAALRAVSDTTTPIDSRCFSYFPKLCGQLFDPKRRQDALARATTTAFQVFDDLGVEYLKTGGHFIDALLDEIIWTRESEILPTIITTNLSVEALKARLPERLIDRLRGDWGRIYECPGPSLRQS